MKCVLSSFMYVLVSLVAPSVVPQFFVAQTFLVVGLLSLSNIYLGKYDSFAVIP